MAFTLNSPRFADVSNILCVGVDSSFRFLALGRVFGIGEGPLGRNDGGAPWLCCVGAVHLQRCGWDDEEGWGSMKGFHFSVLLLRGRRGLSCR